MVIKKKWPKLSRVAVGSPTAKPQQPFCGFRPGGLGSLTVTVQARAGLGMTQPIKRSYLSGALQQWDSWVRHGFRH